MCNRIHGIVGHFQEWNGAAGGSVWFDWHSQQSRTDCSISLSIPGHHTYILANTLILVMSGWASCNSLRTASLHSGGTTTCDPHSRHPSWTDSSSLRPVTEESAGSGPCLTYHNTLDSTGSLFVCLCISNDVTGELCGDPSTAQFLVAS